MKTIWKWILGIILVLVIVGALAAVAFVWWNNAAVTFTPRAAPCDGDWNGRALRGTDGWRHPMMGGRGFSRFDGGFMPFSIGFMFLGGLMRLIPLALVVLAIYVAYRMGKQAGIAAAAMPASAPSPSAPAPGEAGQPAKTGRRARTGEKAE